MPSPKASIFLDSTGKVIAQNPEAVAFGSGFSLTLVDGKLTIGGGGSSLVVTVATDGSGTYNTDGTADEVQINAAIAAINAAGGGIVHIKPGTYNCAANVVMLSNVILEGEGEVCWLKFPVAGTNLSLLSISYWKVRNLKIDSSGKSSGYSSGVSHEHTIQTYNSQHGEIYGCHLECYAFGIFTGTITSLGFAPITQPSLDLHYHDNYIHGLCGNDLIGGGPNGDSDPDVIDVKVTHNYVAQDKSASIGGTYYTAFDITGAKGLSFVDNTCYGHMSMGTERDPNYSSNLCFNHVYPCVGATTTGATIVINDSANEGDVSGNNNIIGNFLYGGYIGGTGLTDQHMRFGVIANNTVINDPAYTATLQRALYLQFADEFTITGNSFFSKSATENAIELSDCLNCNVGDNSVDGYAVGLQVSGTSTGHFYHDNYIINCTATIGSGVMSGLGNSIVNCYGINPDGLLFAQGNITGATTFDRLNGDVITGTLTGNITVTLNATRVPRGSKLTLELTQDATGSRTVTWPSNFKKAGGALVLSTGANAIDIIRMVFDGTNWREVSRALNQS